MTKEQEKHLRTVKRLIGELVDDKYRAGQEEHGGNLFDLTPKQLLRESVDEQIDNLVYTLTALSKLPDDPD